MKPITLPRDLASFVQGKSVADIQRMEDLVNALQNLKVQVSIAGTTKVVSATIQISGDSAVINIQL